MYGSSPASDANSSIVWSVNVTLAVGYHNITIEYHNGNLDGALIVKSGYAGQSTQVRQFHCFLTSFCADCTVAWHCSLTNIDVAA